MPVVSIIVPAFRAEAYLADALDELLGQSLGDVEIVVVDDGSPDGTALIAADYAARHDRIRFFPLEENGGVARAREHAVRNSRGEFLWFVDVDDRRAADALELMVEAARRESADVVVCGAEYAYDDGTTRVIGAPQLDSAITGRRAFRLLLTGAISGHLWNKLFRRDLAEAIDFTPARVHSDLAMTAQLVARARRVASIDDILYSYLLRSGSIIRSGTKRGDSLVLVEDAVSRAASGIDPAILRSPEFRYFRLRYLLLSRMKDALVGPYDPDERAAIVGEVRREISWRGILVVAGRRDWRRLLLAVTAKTAPGVHERVLALAAERAVATASD